MFDNWASRTYPSRKSPSTLPVNVVPKVTDPRIAGTSRNVLLIGIIMSTPNFHWFLPRNSEKASVN